MQVAPSVVARKNAKACASSPSPVVVAAAAAATGGSVSLKKIGKVAKAPKDPSARRLPTPPTIIPPLAQLMHQAACSMPDRPLPNDGATTTLATAALVAQGKQLAKVLSVAAASSPSCVGLHAWVVSACGALESSCCEEQQLRQSLATVTTVNEQMHLYMNTTHRLVVRQKRSLEQSYAALVAECDQIRAQLAAARAMATTTATTPTTAAPTDTQPKQQLSVSTASPALRSVPCASPTASSSSPRLVFDTSSLEPAPMSLGTPRPSANSSLPPPSPRPSTAYSFGPALLSAFPSALSSPSSPSCAPLSPMAPLAPSCYSLFSSTAASSSNCSPSPASSSAAQLQVSCTMECDSDAPLPSPTVVAACPLNSATSNSNSSSAAADAIEGSLRRELMSLRALRDSVRQLPSPTNVATAQQLQSQQQQQQQPSLPAPAQGAALKLRRSKSSEKRGITLTGPMVRALSVPAARRRDSAATSKHQQRPQSQPQPQPQPQGIVPSTVQPAQLVEPLLGVADVTDVTCDNQWLALGRRVIMPATVVAAAAASRTSSSSVLAAVVAAGVPAATTSGVCALPSELSLSLLATSIGTPRAAAAALGALPVAEQLAASGAPLSSSCPSFSMMRAARGFTRRHTS